MSLSEEQKAYENAIREDEREKMLRKVEIALGGLIDIAEKLRKAVGSNLALSFVRDGDFAEVGETASGTKRKRSVDVRVTKEEIERCAEILAQVPEPAKPKQIRMSGLSVKAVSACCRELVKQGRAIVDKRGRYLLVNVSNVPDGVRTLEEAREEA